MWKVEQVDEENLESRLNALANDGWMVHRIVPKSHMCSTPNDAPMIFLDEAGYRAMRYTLILYSLKHDRSEELPFCDPLSIPVGYMVL